MDNLAREAMLAKQNNMSYGRWKALHYVPNAPKAVVEEEKSGYETTCVNCGKVFLRENKRMRLYCSNYCCDRYRYLRKRGRTKEGVYDEQGKNYWL